MPSPFVILLLPVEVRLGRLLIFLVELLQKANIGACVPIRKEDDNRYAQFKTAQKVLNKEMMAKEQQLSTSQRKQTVLDLTSPAKRLLTGEIKNVESKMLDTTFANFFYENALPFNIADLPSLAAVVDQCIEFGEQHPGRRYKAPNRRRFLNQRMSLSILAESRPD